MADFCLLRLSFCVSLCVFLGLSSGASHADLAQTYVPSAVRIIDGDTIEIIDHTGYSERVRLLGIDAPEDGQDFGNRSRQALAECVNTALADGNLFIITNKKDRYDRLVGKVMAGNTDCNLNQITLGLAWHYKAYQSDQSPSDQTRYAQAELDARAQQLGLWRMCAIPPWNYRRGNFACDSVAPAPQVSQPSHPPSATRTERQTPQSRTQIIPARQQCSSLRTMTCRKFTSCAQARAALACGNTRLDGDKDGVPCEAICR